MIFRSKSIQWLCNKMLPHGETEVRTKSQHLSFRIRDGHMTIHFRLPCVKGNRKISTFLFLG